MNHGVSSFQTVLLTILIVLSGCNQGSQQETTTSDSSTYSSNATSDQKIDFAEPKNRENSNSKEAGEKEPLPREKLIESAESEVNKGNFKSAEALLKTALVSEPNDVEVIFRLASVVAASGDLSSAIEYMEAIPADHPEAGLPALGQSADWCFELERFDDAETKYLQVIEAVPAAAEAHRKLAYLFNRQGRRQEAASHIRTLCRLGNVLQDELHALIHLSDAMYDPKDSNSSPRGSSNDGERPYWPIGKLAEARKDFSSQDYNAAVQKLKESVLSGNTEVATIALLGRASAEAQDAEGIQLWMQRSNQDSQKYADQWAALGLVLMQENRLPEAGRALLEAIAMDSTDFRSISRLRSVLESLEKTENAADIEKRFQTLKAIAQENNQIADATQPDTESMLRLANQLASIDRNAEAALWRLLAGFRSNAKPSEMQELQSQLTTVLKSDSSFPDLRSRICGIEMDAFPLPDLELLQSKIILNEQEPSRSRSRTDAYPEFENVAEQVGLQHAYRIAREPQERGFSVYQSVGGAVAVLDFDCDGNPDLYFAQGAADPPHFISTEGNELYRSADDALHDISANSQTDILQYSLGATAGDWNQDGFPDLIVSNIGSNQLLINNGDGTFTQCPIDDRDDKTLMSTSLAIGDLNGDHLPDLFEVNYLHDADLAKRPRRNQQGEVIETLMPKDFQSAYDRVVIQQSDGSLLFQELSENPSNAKAGLGVVITNFDHLPGNEVFVGNDVDANQWWSHTGNTSPWKDSAMLRGCAYGFSGAKTASMGIAAGDFDRNGWMDLHITNFQNESVSHYLNEDGFFRDMNVQFQLSEPSQNVLGFGSQAIDYDLDGYLDIVVANGHIENSVATRRNYEQPAQLFTNLGDQFKLSEVKDKSGYWTSKHVGRGLARLDWNDDGKADLVVTHQSENSALLINQTQTLHHWIQIEVRGTTSERDGIGTRIQVHLQDHVLTEWVTAGDGFFGRNQAIAFFGLGSENKIHKITVDWPSGEKQEFTDLPEVDMKLLLIENQRESFKR